MFAKISAASMLAPDTSRYLNHYVHEHSSLWLFFNPVLFQAIPLVVTAVSVCTFRLYLLQKASEITTHTHKYTVFRENPTQKEETEKQKKIYC